MSRKNIPDAKNRILQAAIKIFAEKSFEGSRVEEIGSGSECAEVFDLLPFLKVKPKSLRYWFKILSLNILNWFGSLKMIPTKPKRENIMHKKSSYVSTGPEPQDIEVLELVNPENAQSYCEE